MFSRKRKELIKTPSISKRSPAGGSHNSSLSVLQEQPRRDAVDSAPYSTSFSVAPPPTGLLDPASSSCPSTPSSLQGPSPTTAGGAAASHSPAQEGVAEGGAAIEVMDIPPLLRDVARFAEAVEKLKDVVMGEGERDTVLAAGIYRVNGVKTRVEKLCQAFENGKELVELSQASPHDISNMLKLYLRQVRQGQHKTTPWESIIYTTTVSPEPIMPFRMYNDLMGAAKESLQAEGGEVGKGAELVDLGPETDPEVVTLVGKLRDLLKDLPPANVSTLRYITRHLRKIAELEQDNKMSPSNLGIVARIVEALIVFNSAIFQPGSAPFSSGPASQSHSQDCTEDGGKEGKDQGDGLEGQPIRTDLEKGVEFCGTSLASSGSQERSLDSDWDQEESGGSSQGKLSRLAKQASETSNEEEPLSPRASMDLSHLEVPPPIEEVTPPIEEVTPPIEEAPPVPASEPPDSEEP
ncbi:hypothetical protein SKAU_G00206040 [Synaphobranchus kaupii]|uniref:Rho-GAP domain-containing protein n=1 Tax=Synaphobranchus kaupii TaxID=118154 RepID=A0A9Q1FGE3_SYNKA|nr:hypothetical protein SKAU_G00206040 [Synaphobranchus kaupii]